MAEKAGLAVFVLAFHRANLDAFTARYRTLKIVKEVY